MELFHQQHLSPPLTPAVSPSNMMDPMQQFKRKYSVDVGPFGFNAHPTLMHDQDAYRRSSCSAMSVDDCVQQHQGTTLDHHHDERNHQGYMSQQHDYDYLTGSSSPSSDETLTTASMTKDPSTNNKNKRRSAQHYQHGPNAPHKHVCKYSYCGWSFKRYEHLKRHMLVHTGERPHVCAFPGCGKSFSRSDNFHAHYRTHIKKQASSPSGQQQLPSATGRRNSKKSNSVAETNLSATMATSTSSSSASTVSTQQELIHAFPSSTQPFVFNNKPFELPYQDIYDQRSFNNEMHDHYSSMTSTQPCMTLNGGGVSSLLNHDQISSSMFGTTTLAPTYDFQGELGQHYTGFNTTTTTSMIQSPSELTTTGGNDNNNNNGTTKKQRKCRSTLLQYNNNDGTMVESGQQKSHVCAMPQCQRRFKRLEHLKRHMRIHTLERPFACTFPKCHKHFSRSDNLAQHMKTHQNRADKRQSVSSSSSSSSSSVSPRSVMDDFTSPNMNNHSSSYSTTCSTIDSYSPSDVVSSLPWSSSESVGC
ncbi:uncharacterized protein BX664DRAFT_301376 [Halteromyces radiatus]|uniref:uncharacterized protein n=1 Tax=Halteromyces radiatus TaxID=101107 RepID=UPI002220055B|nr:uncharacterized protein BX664DRAFT_301376 [Halteromyces radiatus]KAI8082893.1 hypothetical protein BX664DRAFT_301376 [Halteromyces radiatus]